nr:hypothetical protein [Vibrio injensis]
MKRAKWIYAALKEFRCHLQYVQYKEYVSGEMQQITGDTKLL